MSRPLYNYHPQDLHYGHLFSSPPTLPHLHGTSRSGLSPTFLPTRPPSPNSAAAHTLPRPQDYEAEREYQRTKLGGYTSTTLYAMGALAGSDDDADRGSGEGIRVPNLENGIHPLFGRHMWAPLVREDAELWDELVPSLQLASRVLANAHCWPWWDALVYGERRWIPCPPATKEEVMRTFHVRSRGELTEAGFVANDAFVERFRDRIRFMVDRTSSGVTVMQEGRMAHCNSSGYTEYLPNLDIVRVNFAQQMISPLLRNDLWDSERLLSQFQIAKTILHEFTHAIGILLDTDLGRSLRYGEPFFEDQLLSELGESMEKAHFGGRIWSWPSNMPSEGERPILSISIQEWPNYALAAEKVTQGLTQQVHPLCGEGFRPGSTNENMAIPISWVESLFQEDFWAIFVQCFGADAIKPYPRLIINGSRILSINPVTREAQIHTYTVFGPDWEAYQQAKFDVRDSDMEGNEVGLAYHMDAMRAAAAFRQCSILERGVLKYWARMGEGMPET